jgi:hypothetical protein
MQETKIPTLSANSESDLIFSALNFVVEDHAAPANFCVLRRGYATALPSIILKFRFYSMRGPKTIQNI